MKSKSVSLRPIWSPHFNVLWIGEWFTAASGALKTFAKSPRVLTFDEANPTRMTEQCAILVWLLVHRMTKCKNFDIIWHFPRLHDASSCWGYVRWPARDEKQSQDCVLVCEGEIVAKRCKKVFEVCALYFAERSVYTGRKYALRVETDAFQQAFLQLWLWIQPNLDFVASVRNANIREILYKGFCKRSWQWLFIVSWIHLLQAGRTVCPSCASAWIPSRNSTDVSRPRTAFSSDRFLGVTEKCAKQLPPHHPTSKLSG